ncbi:SubName: Full=Probable thioredoxin {ECO:0000313/EMBL:CCA66519.1} [Serendipita indica DSM 11827]|nr:SubName: Full=Probable thioredoxin {ECO:0000313/EMBL:CCA66519.1} [Serendipita indica DSM 11827]
MKVHSLLQRACIVRCRLPPLPLEIWYQILDFTLDIPEALGSTCTSEGIWEYLYYHRFQQHSLSGKRVETYTKLSTPWSDSYTADPKHPYELHRKQRLNLRLVCSTWDTILRQCPTAWSFGSSAKDFRFVKRLDLILAHTQGMPNHDQNIITSARDLNPARLRILAIYDSSSSSPTHGDAAPTIFDLIKQRPEIVRNLSCFSYTGAHMGHFDSLWPLFINLTTLIVEMGEIIEMNVELPRLQVLMLKSTRIRVRKWRCPSLRHLVLVYLYSIIAPLNLEIPAIISPSSLLTLVVYNRRLIVNEEFWQSYSSLIHIGSSNLDYQYPPPLHHPLSHLSVIDPVLSESTVTALRSLTSSGHPIKSIRFLPYYHYRSFDSPVERWNQLLRHIRDLRILGPFVPFELIERASGLNGYTWRRSRSVMLGPWPRESWWIEMWLESRIKRWEGLAIIISFGMSATAVTLGATVASFHGAQLFTVDERRWLVVLDFLQYELVGLAMLLLFLVVHSIYIGLTGQY